MNPVPIPLIQASKPPPEHPVNYAVIPQSDPHSSYLLHHASILDALVRTLDSGRLVLGPRTFLFEEMFASFLCTADVIGVGSGTDALVIALRACEVEPGDAVITVSYTATATVAAIELAEAIPVLADIDPVTFTLCPESLEATIREYSARPEAALHPLKAVIVVHLFGHPADLPAIVKICALYNLILIEDCAQAHGASYGGRMVGSWGKAGAFSFHPTQNLAAVGDGGAVATSVPAVAQKARQLRQYGWKERYVSFIPGMNSRLDEIQAAVLQVRLPHLTDENSSRRAIANCYNELLADVPVVCPVVHGPVNHVFHQYVLRSPQRNAIREWLKTRGIQTRIHYPFPIHLQPAYQDRLFHVKGGLPHSETAARELLSLPMYPQLNEDQISRTAAAVAGFYTRNKFQAEDGMESVGLSDLPG